MKLPSAIWAPFTGSAGMPHARAVNKVVLHRTQGSTAQGAFGVYTHHQVEPHFTADAAPSVNKIWQHVDTGRAAHSLRVHDRDGVIQVEIVGFSERAAEWTSTEYRNLVVMLRPVFEHHGIPYTSTVSRPWPRTGDEGYGTESRRRMTSTEFHNYSGVCGHSHVPDNSHWDPGDFDIGLWLDLLTNRTPTTQPTNEEDEMPYLFGKYTKSNTIFAMFPGGTVRSLGPHEWGFYQRQKPAPKLVTTSSVSEYKKWTRAAKRA